MMGFCSLDMGLVVCKTFLVVHNGKGMTPVSLKIASRFLRTSTTCRGGSVM